MGRVKNLNVIALREYRESIGLTQQELATLLNVNHRTVSAYEVGTRKPSIKTGLKLTKIFNAKIEDIFPQWQ